MLLCLPAFGCSLCPFLTALLQRCIECGDRIDMGTQLVVRSGRVRIVLHCKCARGIVAQPDFVDAVHSHLAGLHRQAARKIGAARVRLSSVLAIQYLYVILCLCKQLVAGMRGIL